MSTRLDKLRDTIVERRQGALRRDVDWNLLLPKRAESRCARAAEGLQAVLQEESKTPVFLPGERICLTRTCRNLPARYSESEMAALRKTAYFHEMGVVFNISPNYAETIECGLEARRAEVESRLACAKDEGDAEGVDFLRAVLQSMDAVLQLTDAYRDEAERQGLKELTALLNRVPRQGARTFHEALQFLRILHYVLWCEGDYHNGLGRVDQYLYPWLASDLAAGRITEEEALELLQEFFLACNRDSDLYVGVQQGDNGQSLMLGGCDASGKDATNLLTLLALEAAKRNRLIDPKINLRVSSQTDPKLYEKATELTRLGLGFPQYANDDIVIPGLVQLGYSLEDARDYTVAACWEFIIPGCGMDIPNIGAVSFPGTVDTVMRQPEAKECESFSAFQKLVRQELFLRADRLQESLTRVDMLPCPFISSLCQGRIAAARDVSLGNKYNNFGIHGTGLATAVDSLAVIKELVFDRREMTLPELVTIVDRNFEGADALYAKVRYHIPKMGNDEQEPDEIAVSLLADFADSWAGRVNSRGGCFRAGTGSAMYYLWHANELPASPDGRLRNEPFPANYAPSLGVSVKGPISVVASFTKPDLKRTVNGGPLTIELHDSVFAQSDGLEKVARLVQFFVDQGGHQLQINTINRDTLLDAQEHPEKWRHLIVRVWGWSGYFVELDKPYQDQIIKRAEMTFTP
ncbi:MAG: pyruvate formate lyase family protein [Planctomycetia bacterium]|nr:pyruvate formate lyase family protein [Planctomycetia bacterium]